MEDLSRAQWRKATKSQANGNCVELAQLSGGRVAVRDSKDGGLGPVHIYTAAEIAAFFDGVKAGEFDDLAG